MKKLFSYAATILMLMSMPTGAAVAESPAGFASATLAIGAQVTIACREAQHGAFPNPITIDTLSGTDQTFAPTSDETVECTNGTVFTIKVTSANGTAVNQTCTSGGVSGMLLKSAASPSDTIAYELFCAGDTDGSGKFTGSGFSTARSLGMGIKVAAVDAQAAAAHADYSDIVTLTISY